MTTVTVTRQGSHIKQGEKTFEIPPCGRDSRSTDDDGYEHIRVLPLPTRGHDMVFARGGTNTLVASKVCKFCNWKITELKPQASSSEDCTHEDVALQSMYGKAYAVICNHCKLQIGAETCETVAHKKMLETLMQKRNGIQMAAIYNKVIVSTKKYMHTKQSKVYRSLPTKH